MSAFEAEPFAGLTSGRVRDLQPRRSDLGGLRHRRYRCAHDTASNTPPAFAAEPSRPSRPSDLFGPRVQLALEAFDSAVQSRNASSGSRVLMGSNPGALWPTKEAKAAD